MYNYLKKSLFSFMIILMPYMNTCSKAMDTEDYEGSSIRSRISVNIKENKELFNDVSTHPNSSQPLNSEEFVTEEAPASLKSYVLSPVKSVIQSAYDVVNFVTYNRNRALIFGVYLSCQVIAVAARPCVCICQNVVNHTRFSIGMVHSPSVCNNACYTISSRDMMYSCVNGK